MDSEVETHDDMDHAPNPFHVTETDIYDNTETYMQQYNESILHPMDMGGIVTYADLIKSMTEGSEDPSRDECLGSFARNEDRAPSRTDCPDR